jgi:NADPH:quinone reductase-like Zn-dependent oxidoreductase
MAATRGRGVDIILDPIGGAYLNQNLDLLKENGRLVNIGLLGGSSAEINLGTVLGKSLRVIGTRLRSRPLARKIDITGMFADRFWPLLEAGRLQPIIDSVFRIEDADSAHDHVKQNKNTGKVVLEITTAQ